MRRTNPKADPIGRLPDVHPSRIPRHVAIIMDGNGRWAQRKGLHRVFGHQAGAKVVRSIVEEAGALGIEVVTLYSFSLDNWKRPPEEVQALMALYLQYLARERRELIEENIRFVQVGRREGLPPEVLCAVDDLMEATRGNTRATLCLAVNYGSRGEIVDAARSLARRVKDGSLEPEQIDESVFERHLYTAGLPDPDLLIRTAGERRLSNYLLWQISYAELHITDVLWPDFSVQELYTAIRDYASRSRRFGGLTEGPLF
ncbi:MAG: isoprenyl transferase [Phycisphaerae bacterium]|nr:isoprenyl transferase [Phycisphaerae bacterium]